MEIIKHINRKKGWLKKERSQDGRNQKNKEKLNKKNKLINF